MRVIIQSACVCVCVMYYSCCGDVNPFTVALQGLTLHLETKHTSHSMNQWEGLICGSSTISFRLMQVNKVTSYEVERHVHYLQ